MQRDYSRLEKTAYARASMARTALVVGAGALGNEVIKNLALLGIRTLWIADRDTVEASNLTRSILYCTPDVDKEIAQGTPKAVFAARRALEINPDLDVKAWVGEIADLGAGVLRRADVVFSCLDNEMARLELSWWCMRLNRVLIDGGLGLMNYSSGMVSVFPGSQGPCYACRKGSDRRSQLLQDLYGREDPCWIKAAEIIQHDGVPTTPVMASVVGAFQVELALRNPPPDGATSGQAHEIILYPTPRLNSHSFSRSETCPLHDRSSTIGDVMERADRRSGEWTVASLLAEAGQQDGALILDWPMTARAGCASCGYTWEPLLRRARFRRARCPKCGASELNELEVLTTIEGSSEWAERTLSSLGLPAGHIHEISSKTDGTHTTIHVEVTGDL